MVCPKKNGFGDDSSDGSDPRREAESTEIHGSDTTSRRGIAADSLTERLRDVLRDESNGDPLLDRSGIEIGISRWLRALDLQIIGACRAGERMKPLIKLDISNGAAEDVLLSQLSLHFGASEVGMLARCLCVPLVSIRVGKVNKQGNILCPTAARGHLDLTLLPSSNMRISFTGDDGCTERLALLSNNLDSSEAVIEEISADSSGRSFAIKLQGSQVMYFWCSEKSKLHGIELLAKMKDLLRRKPSLSHLTGIHQSLLESFATHLRTYLGSSSASKADPVEPPTTPHKARFDPNSPPPIPNSSPCHFSPSQISKGDGIREKFTSSSCSQTIQPEVPALPSSIPLPPLSSLFSAGLLAPPVLPTSQQVSTFVPFMSDPIVHIPMIGVCSSGQGYLVSAGPAVSPAAPPFANPLIIPSTESEVEKSARETLRMLMASTPTFASLKPTNVTPPFLHTMDRFSSAQDEAGGDSVGDVMPNAPNSKAGGTSKDGVLE